MPQYRLHSFPESGNSYKVALMLELSGQAWEPVWTDFQGGQTRSPEWRATVNEMGEIPVLEDGGERLTQSAAILLRLAECHGQFGPRDDAERQELLRWLFWDNHKLTSYMATYRFLHAFTADPDHGVLAFLHGRLENALAVAERRLERAAFVLGERPTVADLSMCGYLFYSPSETGHDLRESHPAVTAWLARIAALPGWRGPYELLPGKRFTPVSATAAGQAS
jgi:glutathione S-transferase